MKAKRSSDNKDNKPTLQLHAIASYRTNANLCTLTLHVLVQRFRFFYHFSTNGRGVKQVQTIAMPHSNAHMTGV